MEDMGPHIARNHPGMQVVKLMTRKYDINNYEVKKLRVMMPRLKKCGFCGLLGCGKPHYEFLVRPCKVMMPMLKNCTFCGVLGCDQVTDWCDLTDSE